MAAMPSVTVENNILEKELRHDENKIDAKRGDIADHEADKLNFLIRTLDEQKVPLVHFTTCQAVQLHQ